MWRTSVRKVASNRAALQPCRVRVLSTTSGSAEEGERKFIVPTYSKGGVRTKEGLVFVKGQGSTITDSTGRDYVDFGAGIAVTVLGHCDPEWQAAIKDQVDKLVHTSNLYHTTGALQLAETLLEHSPGMARVFFCNSGTEATEAAIKFCRVYQNAQGQAKQRNRFISFKKSFHGRSLGALSLTYKPAIREPFGPMLMPNVDHLEYNNLKALEASIGPDVIAVILEPVQGEGGIQPATREFIQKARELCDQNGVLLIFDEVQIGLGRQGNGKLWSYEEYGVTPDVVTMAKPLANGLPIGGIMMSESMYTKVPEAAWAGTHGSTFAANPLVTTAASAVLDKLTSPGFLDTVKENGEHLIAGLDAMKQRLGKKVLQVRRPLGDAALYAGIQLPGPFVGPVISHCLEKGVIVLSAGDDGTVIRLCPPLVISKEEIDTALVALEEAIDQHVKVPDATCKETTARPTIEFSSASLASSSPSDYEAKLTAAGHAELPEGFSVGLSALEFFPEELPRTEESQPASMNLTLLVPERPTSCYAALFTSNAFPGAPIKVGREIVKSGKPLGGIVINNKISNVHPRGSGVQDATTIASAVAKAIGISEDSAVIPCSTGVIGWRLPVDSMLGAVPDAVASLESESIMPAAKGIMTTDTFPKARSCVVKGPDGSILGRFTGIAKGAGMVEPNLATMLVYVMTDLDVSQDVLNRALANAVNAEGSFNRISVDSDQSTSDTIIVMSSQKKEKLPADQEESVITEALSYVCRELAQDVVRNGEGTQHVIRVNVAGSPTNKLAHGIGKAVVNSPLVKTAIAGNDANVGRIIAAMGSYVGAANPGWADIVANECEIKVGSETVFKNGEFVIDDKKEVILQKYLQDSELPQATNCPTHYNTVDIDIFLRGSEHTGGYSSTVYGSDLTHTYVDVNAGYRS
mmetsp:Transcript_9695/g.17059  ORF Transcript_9695/g.17059 Transcript_9695/m.17059 type:complete len:919 (+) Transcript_9695:74-2830(+)